MSAGEPQLRASDADREAVANALRTHCSVGRLDVAELEERLAAAFAARTLAELDRLLADLPGGRPAAAAPRSGSPTPVKAGLPGLRGFHQRHVLSCRRSVAFEQAREHIVPVMVRAGYDVVGEAEPRMLVFECQERPAWVLWVCVLAFPLGLLALTVRDAQRIVLTFDELGADHTRVVVQGRARRVVRKAFASLSADEAPPFA